ncbi:dimethylarginine dimethylaminohydrolase family protein [Clostridium lundense]|uniref:dimethylarginine dimethylaminohydrolase family protein n=1 Tax=Clostridium lundense TaxID=319475 RepID=UPI0004852F3D|nr:arginine deiminase family protein [Clostridium lundense]
MKIHLNNQYDKLIYYLMVYPCKYEIIDPGNPYKNKINYHLMYSQYNNFVNLLIESGIKVQFLDIMDSPSQVFSRDIGFVVKDILFISKLKSPERINEPNALKIFAKKHNLKTYEMKNNIEGGDVILHDEVMFVGMSRRSTREACDEVQEVLDKENIDVKVLPINFDNHKLHLDCVFNTIDRDNCIISDYVYDVDIIKKYMKNLIRIDHEAADKLGSNFVCLGDKRILTSNENVKNILCEYGYNAIYSDYSEVIKAGGSFTCSTLPILRI